MRGALLGRLTARAVIVLVSILAATALGAALVVFLGPDAPPSHAPPEPAAGAAAEQESADGGFIVLAQLPTPTDTPTRPPLPTATVLVSSPTPTATETAEPTLTPMASPTDTPAPRPTSTPILPTLTPAEPPPPTPMRFAAPPLIAPASGSSFSEGDAVELVWGSVGTLPPGVFYAITLAYPHGEATWYDETPWIQETRWTMSEHRYLLDLADGGQFRWWVQVMQHTGTGADGRPTGIPLGPASETWTLTWRRSSGGGGGGSRDTPEPPPP